MFQAAWAASQRPGASPTRGSGVGAVPDTIGVTGAGMTAGGGVGGGGGGPPRPPRPPLPAASVPAAVVSVAGVAGDGPADGVAGWAAGGGGVAAGAGAGAGVEAAGAGGLLAVGVTAG